MKQEYLYVFRYCLGGNNYTNLILYGSDSVVRTHQQNLGLSPVPCLDVDTYKSIPKSGTDRLLCLLSYRTGTGKQFYLQVLATELEARTHALNLRADYGSSQPFVPSQLSDLQAVRHSVFLGFADLWGIKDHLEFLVLPNEDNTAVKHSLPRIAEPAFLERLGTLGLELGVPKRLGCFDLTCNLAYTVAEFVVTFTFQRVVDEQ